MLHDLNQTRFGPWGGKGVDDKGTGGNTQAFSERKRVNDSRGKGGEKRKSTKSTNKPDLRKLLNSQKNKIGYK